MITAVLSFLGGGTVRWVLEAIFGYLNKAQDAKHERELLLLQMQLAERRAQLQMQAIEKAGEVSIKLAELQGWVASMRNDTASGVAWVDALRASVRPTVAYLLVATYIVTKLATHQPMDEFDRGILGSVLGWYYGDRSLAKRQA